MWSGKSQLPSSQRLRLHRLASSDLGLRTWAGTMCDPALTYRNTFNETHYKSSMTFTQENAQKIDFDSKKKQQDQL